MIKNDYNNPNINDLQSNVSDINALPEINDIIKLSDCVPIDYDFITLLVPEEELPENSSIKTTKKLPLHFIFYSTIMKN